MKILTPLQHKTLQVFFSVPELKRHFYLTGGTALSAFYLQHRLSIDLDFFTHSIDIHEVEPLIEDAFKAKGLRIEKERSSPTFRRWLINKELRVDVVRDIDFRVGTPQLIDNFMVDDPKNIAVNKITTIYGRLEPKDYVDLYFLKPYLNFDIMELFKLGQIKDGGLEPFQWAKIIADVDTFTLLPQMVKPLTLKKLQTFFHRLRGEVIDSLKKDIPIDTPYKQS
ncbi:MAG: nucleotidyl transferase AbiEii/AbiGii toxin family protein [Deltaproteobacteria bacterium]|nr:nucleotidyl transferase AbiEii/AbiGii toxin family protein [Deltaproteobacteria bacterium]